MTDDLSRSPVAAPDATTPDATTPSAATPDATPSDGAPGGTTPTGTAADTPDAGSGIALHPGLAAAAEPEKPRRGRPKGATSSARTTRVVELCLTVSEGADGEWQAELKQGAAWISRGLPVSAAAVLRAAQELHAELAEPIEAAIGAAREARAARVAALEAELEQARKALAELEV